MSRVDDAIKLASAIHGWCEAGEMRWLAEQAAEHRFIIEIGSWQGRSTKALAVATPGTVYVVDDFRGAGGAAANGWLGPGGFPLGTGSTPTHELERIFRQNLAAEIKKRKVIVSGIGSPEAAANFKHGSADLIYIDGDHETDAVRSDLQAWIPVLAEGGVLCGHDAHDERVQAALEAEGVDYEIVVDNLWRQR